MIKFYSLIGLLLTLIIVGTTFASEIGILIRKYIFFLLLAWYVLFLKTDETEPYLEDYQREVGNETDLVVYRLFTRSVIN
jgi:hypothetical protein